MDIPAISVVGESPKLQAGKEARMVEIVKPGSFEPELHFYPRVLNAQIHPLVRSFLNLGNERIAKRYTHLHPEAKPEAVTKALSYSCRYFQWGGADLFTVTTEKGHKQFVLVETNSCPSGQKSMPLANEDLEQAGYRVLLEKALVPTIRAGVFNGYALPEGGLAVLYDKNFMEASGYAAVLADLMEQDVYLVPCYADEADPKSRFREDGVLEIKASGARVRTPKSDAAANGNGTGGTHPVTKGTTSKPVSKQWATTNPVTVSGPVTGPVPVPVPEVEEWIPIRAAVRYVTQRPWSRIPPLGRTLIFNPVLACLAGGRNKAVAAKAYDLHNADMFNTGLSIFTPETIWDVSKPEIPLWVGRMGGLAVVKVPYANAGQGVWTITHEGELKEFMAIEHRYDSFIVQSLIGNHGWSSLSTSGRLYHVGTIPNRKGEIYAADIRLMVGSSPEGFFPVAIYARRARDPLTDVLEEGANSWDMLGTNLSYKNVDGSWGTETERLLLMDSRDFNRIGIGIDDLIEAYMQTILSVTAIDKLACKLITPKGNFGLKLFQALNPDPKLLAELFCTQLDPPMRPPQPPLATGIGALGKRQLEESLAPPKRAWSPEEEAVVQAELACMDTEESLAAELEMKMEEALPPGKRKRHPIFVAVA